jgi:hypothetical protein
MPVRARLLEIVPSTSSKMFVNQQTMSSPVTVLAGWERRRGRY